MMSIREYEMEMLCHELGTKPNKWRLGLGLWLDNHNMTTIQRFFNTEKQISGERVKKKHLPTYSIESDTQKLKQKKKNIEKNK